MRYALEATIAALLIGGAAGCAEFAESSREVVRSVDDANISNDVASEFANDRARSTLADVDVNTRDGVVYLTGTVPDTSAERLAIGIARDVRGVREVVSNLRTEPVNIRDRDKRGASDAQITAAIEDRLANDGARASLAHVDVSTTRGTVRLTGTVPDATAKVRAGQLAREISGVRNVVDGLQVVPNSAAGRDPTTLTSAEWDDVISLAVVQELRKGGNTAFTDVKVKTTNKTVYLTGRVANAASKARAAAVAKSVGGVERVVNNLQTSNTRGSRNSNQ
jgi:osmotically-inducible protein OsmY